MPAALPQHRDEPRAGPDFNVLTVQETPDFPDRFGVVAASHLVQASSTMQLRNHFAANSDAWASIAETVSA